jgi:chaperonin GroEL
MAKEIIYNIEAREKLKKGVDAVADAVKVTLGPAGRLVAIEGYGVPHLTKDGVTVAKDIYLEDRSEDMGAQMVKSVSAKSAEIAGDGTTTATVLAQAMVADGIKMVTAGCKPIDLKKGMEKALAVSVKKLEEISDVVGDDLSKIAQVATVSANNDKEIGDLVAKAFEEVGKDGVITVEVGSGSNTEVVVEEGMQLGRGMLSPFFATDVKNGVCEFDGTNVLLYDGKISNMEAIVPLFEESIAEQKAFLVISDGVEQTVLQTMVANKMKAGFKVCAIKAPSFGQNKKDILEDLAVLLNGTVVSPDKGMDLASVTKDCLGQASKVAVTNSITTLVGGAGNNADIQNRVDALNLNRDKTDSPQRKEQLTERIGKLSGGVAVIKVGATTEVEMKEKKDRVDDALAATQAAVKEGIIAGGGMGLINCIVTIQNVVTENNDERFGSDIVAKACEAPLRQIVDNAGGKPDVVISNVSGGDINYGYNARTEVFEDLMKAGVIDPTMVTRVALENAVSIASMVLMTECVISDKPSAEAQQVSPYNM